MYLNIVMIVLFVYTSCAFAKEIKFEDLSADVQQELLSGLNDHERPPTSFVKKVEVVTSTPVVVTPSKPEVVAVKAVPDKFITEPLRVAKKKVINPKIEFDCGVRFKSFQGMDRVLDRGFSTEASNETGVRLQPFVQLKVDKVALQFLQNDTEEILKTKIFDSSLGELTVNTPVVLIGKYFFINTPEYSVSIGLGAEYTEIGGAVSMGGFKFPTKGEGWSQVIQLSSRIDLTKQLSVGLDYEKSDLRIVTEIPGVPDLVTKYTDRWGVTVFMRVF